MKIQFHRGLSSKDTHGSASPGPLRLYSFHDPRKIPEGSIDNFNALRGLKGKFRTRRGGGRLAPLHDLNDLLRWGQDRS